MSLFRVPKPKPYRFKPRYYNEEKEIREARERRIKKEFGIQEEGKANYVSNIKGQMQTGFSDARRTRRKSNSRLMIILIILLTLFYFLFYV